VATYLSSDEFDPRVVRSQHLHDPEKEPRRSYPARHDAGPVNEKAEGFDVPVPQIADAGPTDVG
jgi:hypothetical protein